MLDNDTATIPSGTRESETTSEPVAEKKATATAKTQKKAAAPGRIVRFIRDRRTRIFTGILLICWATFTLFSSISYFTSGAEDQSLVTGQYYSTNRRTRHRKQFGRCIRSRTRPQRHIKRIRSGSSYTHSLFLHPGLVSAP